jgi:hypothetical protein
MGGQLDLFGEVKLEESEPMTINDIARALNLHPHEIRHLKSSISKMIELESLRWNDNHCLDVINFQKRQEVFPSDLAHNSDNSEITPKKLRVTSELAPVKILKEEEGRGERKKEVDVDINKEKEGNLKGTRKARADPRVSDIFHEMRRFFGYPDKTDKDPIPNPAKEGQFIKKMFSRHFTQDEILNCWKLKVQQRRGGFVSMVLINEDIGDFVRSGEPVPTVKPDYEKAARGGGTPVKKQTDEGRRQYEQRESPERQGAATYKPDALAATKAAGWSVIGEEGQEPRNQD